MNLEVVDNSNWEELCSGTAVLMIGKSDCAACIEWTEELTTYLAGEVEFPDIRYGKITLDKPGLHQFKKANTWIAEITDLPCTVIYVNGERTKSFYGKGTERLNKRLGKLLA